MTKNERKNTATNHILIQVGLSIIFLLVFVLIIFLKPILMQNLMVFQYMILEMISIPILYCIGPATLLSILIMRRTLKVQNRKVIRVLFICSVVFIILYILCVIYFAMTFNYAGYPELFMRIIEWLMEFPFVFTFVGIIFFYHVNGFNEEDT